MKPLLTAAQALSAQQQIERDRIETRWAKKLQAINEAVTEQVRDRTDPFILFPIAEIHILDESAKELFALLENLGYNVSMKPTLDARTRMYDCILSWRNAGEG